jgi:hypothetical protein
MLKRCSLCKPFYKLDAAGVVPLTAAATNVHTCSTRQPDQANHLRRNRNTCRRVDGPYVRHRLSPKPAAAMISVHAPTMSPTRSLAVQAAATAPAAMAMDATFKSAVAVSDVA